MAIISRKITQFLHPITSMKDTYRNEGTNVKALFQSCSDELKDAHNSLVDDLASTANGTSGADNIGATQLATTSGNTVMSILRWLHQQVTGITLGQVPDESVGAVKLTVDLQNKIKRADRARKIFNYKNAGGAL